MANSASMLPDDEIAENEDDIVEVRCDIWDPTQVTTMSHLQAKSFGLGQNTLRGKKQNTTTNGTNYARTMGTPYSIPRSQITKTTPRQSTTTSLRKPIPFGLNRCTLDGRSLDTFLDGSFQGEVSRGHKKPGAGMAFQPKNTLNGQRNSQRRNEQSAFSSADGQRNYLTTVSNAVDDDSSDELCRDPSVEQSRIPKDKPRRVSSSSPAVEEYLKVERMMSPHSRKRKYDEVDIYEDDTQTKTPLQSLRQQREQKRRATTQAKRKRCGSELQEITPRSASSSCGNDERTRSRYFPDVQPKHQILSRPQSRHSTSDRVYSTTSSPQRSQDSSSKHKRIDSKTGALDKTSFISRVSDPLEVEDSPSKSLPSGPERTRKRNQVSLNEGEKSWWIENAETNKALWEGCDLEILMDTNAETLCICIDGKPQHPKFLFKQLDRSVQYSDAYARFRFKDVPPATLWIASKDCRELIRQMNDALHFENMEESDEDMFKWVIAWKQEQRNWYKNGKPSHDLSEVSIRSGNQRSSLPAANIINSKSQDHGHKESQAGSNSSMPKVKLSKRLQDENGSRISPIHKVENVSGLDSSRKRKILDMPADEVDELAVSEGFDFPNAGSHRPRAIFKRMKAQQDSEIRRSLRNSGTSPPTRQLPARVPRTRKSYAELDTMIEPKPERFSVVHGLGPKWTEPLVFPREGRNRVTVEFEDLERLDEGELLNDNLVEFALRYLKSRRDDLKNIYWFSTYFFEQLTKAKKKNINYDGVKRWTKDVDLFSYDYVVVPINENFHWYLAVICNLPALKKAAMNTTPADITATHEIRQVAEANHSVTVKPAIQANQTAHDEDLELSINRLSMDSPGSGPENSSRSILVPSSQTDQKFSAITEGKKSRLQTRRPDLPTIVTMDSLGVSHQSTIVALKSYLKQEAQEKFGFSWEASDITGMTAKGIPTQNNLSDCGLYLIKYAHTLAWDAAAFVHKLLQKELDPEKDFNGSNPAELRTRLREEIIRLQKNQVSGNKQGSHQARTTSDEFESRDLVEVIPQLRSDSKAQKEKTKHSSTDITSDLLNSLERSIHTSSSKGVKSVQHSPARRNSKKPSDQVESEKYQTRGSSLPLLSEQDPDVQKTKSQHVAEPRSSILHYQTTEVEEESEVPETPPSEANELDHQPPYIDLTSVSKPVV